MQGIIERLEIGIKFVLHVPGQEAQPFSCLDGRAGEHDLLNLVVLQSPDSQSDGSICFPGAGRTFGNDKIIAGILFHKLKLVDSACPDRPSAGAEYKSILEIAAGG